MLQHEFSMVQRGPDPTMLGKGLQLVNAYILFTLNVIKI